ncbi:MAG TPA: gas vesicle protein [Solirubrobacteraceae bacterium]|jgi:Gas vesicle protein
MTGNRAALAAEREVALVEVLDRALGAGVVITGDLTISLAEVDLIHLDLRLLVGSVGTIRGAQPDTVPIEVPSIGWDDTDWQ